MRDCVVPRQHPESGASMWHRAWYRRLRHGVGAPVRYRIAVAPPIAWPCPRLHRAATASCVNWSGGLRHCEPGMPCRQDGERKREVSCKGTVYSSHAAMVCEPSNNKPSVFGLSLCDSSEMRASTASRELARTCGWFLSDACSCRPLTPNANYRSRSDGGTVVLDYLGSCML